MEDWLQPLPNAAEQRALDAWAIEQCGLGGGLLMERAGAALAARTAHHVPAGRIAVVCGKGNNGGDGLVAARHLRNLGREVDVLLTSEDLRDDARLNLERLPGSPATHFSPAALTAAAGIVDALLGTGSSGPARPEAGKVIHAMNSADALVIACDVPSGVDASTGEVAGAATRAFATVTFGAAKPGLWINPGKRHSGIVEVVDIGIPPGGPGTPSVGLVEEAVLGCVPVRGGTSDKFAAGSVLVIGGSRGLTGAPCMASEAAMRAGAGYVTLAGPASLELVFEQRLLEVMSVGLPDAEGALTPAALPLALARSERVDTVVLGPGLGRGDATVEFVRRFAQDVDRPLLVDADGLNAFAGRLDELSARAAPTVLTPHAGELGRLLGTGSEEVGRRRLHAARAAARLAAAIVVLKGDDTIVATPDGQVGVSRGNAPALATAGTGDVLAGICAALLSKKGLDPFTAACAAVRLHLRAGQLAAQTLGGVEGVIASDVIAALPGVRR